MTPTQTRNPTSLSNKSKKTCVGWAIRRTGLHLPATTLSSFRGLRFSWSKTGRPMCVKARRTRFRLSARTKVPILIGRGGFSQVWRFFPIYRPIKLSGSKGSMILLIQLFATPFFIDWNKRLTLEQEIASKSTLCMTLLMVFATAFSTLTTLFVRFSLR